ncbi:hypothetical protein Ae406Ps2_6049 [Pseudonocardia sp. Ae406_Ps2]|nr:hypothetical protein Ae331Ps2_5919c [Pseudonocardia sp. Ae331_Ps2]OLL96213.1 hypothetical protein Ae406Ps2_6049 [Pseudonocardia sp. Ae406_Ps2]OLM08577.1 hypothetical protein Ae505Ps2_5964 [Pseudonocardia sp. Ae505_Ps2]OLM09509.1 hypothetical protein Ae706Ps2_5971c [Pseudonocardia sp. Ae706_Ps2]OLM27779.1 hypothetical protein Ae717Ps2_6997c [Pseudonocardia sp. Ae717_Ps2]
MSRERSSVFITSGGIALICALIGAAFLFMGEDVFVPLAFFGLGVGVWASGGSPVFARTGLSRTERKREAATRAAKARKIDPAELRKWRERNPSYGLAEAIEKYWEENR